MAGYNDPKEYMKFAKSPTNIQYSMVPYIKK